MVIETLLLSFASIFSSFCFGKMIKLPKIDELYKIIMQGFLHVKFC